MSQTLAQRLGLHNAQPYVREQRIIAARAKVRAARHAARAARAQRRAAWRAAALRGLRAVGDTARTAWLAAAPWTAAMFIVIAIGTMQIADNESQKLARVTAERDTLATTARRLADVLDHEYLQQPLTGPRHKRVTAP